MNIAIVGAGATGLAAALDLRKAGHAVTVFEASDRPGGLASGFKEPHWNWSLERFYHHWFASDRDLLAVADEIGARHKVVFKRPVTVSYYNGEFLQLDSPLSALLFRGLSLPAKIPFGLAGVYLKLTGDWRSLERHTAHDWLSRWMGKPAYELLFQPLLEGKFGAHFKQVNMAWFWARIKARTSRLGTYVGGFQQFFEDLAAHVISLGAIVRYSTPVERVETAGDGAWRVTPRGGPDERFDRVLVTTSPRLMTRLAPQLPPAYLGALNALTSLGAAVVIFSLDRPLSPKGHYWHNLPKSAGFPFLAMCEHTNFASADDFGGDRLIYCGDYLAADHEYFSMSDDALAETFMKSLGRFNPQFEPSWVKRWWVFREGYAQPVPFVNHSRNIPPLKTPLGGLWFASMSHVYPWDRGTNYALQLGRAVAGDMIAPAGSAVTRQ